MGRSNERGRRAVLRTIATAGALGLPGCASNGRDSSSTTPAENQPSARETTETVRRKSTTKTGTQDDQESQGQTHECIKPYDDITVGIRDTEEESKFWNTYTVTLVTSGSDVENVELRGDAGGQTVSEVGESVTARGLTKGEVVEVVANVCGDETLKVADHRIYGRDWSYQKLPDTTVVDATQEGDSLSVEVESLGPRPTGVAVTGCSGVERTLKSGESTRVPACDTDDPIELAAVTENGPGPKFATIAYPTSDDVNSTSASFRVGAFVLSDEIEKVGVELSGLGEGTKGVTVDGCATAGLATAGALINAKDCTEDPIHVEVVPES